MRKYILICSVLLAHTFAASANNLRIGTVTEIINGSNHYLQFSISWDNSWRITGSPANRDAVWLFVKRKDCGSNYWVHANLATQDTAHTADSPLFVDAYSDKKGVMVYRTATGAGHIDSVNIQLKLDAPPVGDFEYKVLGVEMVYIPAAAFYVGDGTSAYHFRTGNTLAPYLVASEAAIPLSNSGTNLWSINQSGPYTLPAAYPKGYKAFYCMKYEISQGQYAEFLNSIPYDAVVNRYDAGNVNHQRYTIGGTWPLLTADVPDRACNYLSTQDLLAYLDWSALSPISELEFEKACRGTNAPVTAEYAWGTGGITRTDSLTTGTENTPNETVSNYIVPGTGPALYQGVPPSGPLRCGFAAKAGTSRVAAGASFYGIMELSGNVLEFCVNVDSSNWGASRTFTGNHGDGELFTAPNAGFSNAGWPGQITGDPNAPVFSFALRGGSWSTSFPEQLRVSDRSVYIYNTGVASPDPYGRSHSSGGRGVSRR
jgi:formylglycine-generating enzyme required for sulfatase activity